MKVPKTNTKMYDKPEVMSTLCKVNETYTCNLNNFIAQNIKILFTQQYFCKMNNDFLR